VEENNQENQSSQPSPASQEDGDAMQRAQDALINEVAQDSNVKDTQKKSEEEFIDFAAQKNSEIKQTEQYTLQKQQNTELKKVSETEPKKKRDVIRTYHTDVAETIQNEKLSLTNIVVAEQKERDGKTSESSPSHSTSLLQRIVVMLASAVLVITAISVLVFLYLRYTRIETVPADAPAGSLILANEKVQIDTVGLRRDKLLQELAITADAYGSQEEKGILSIDLLGGLDDTSITAEVFLEILGTSIDAAFLRSIEDEFMLGIHQENGPHFFLIIKTSFFENAFAGMLRWEKQLPNELPFLVRNIIEEKVDTFATSSDETSTTTGPVVTAPVVLDFEDMVISNKDVRARMASDGAYDILYSFADPETLVITDNPMTLRAVFERLVIARFEQ